MGAQELNHSPETLQQDHGSWQDFGDEETLSLCDLVIGSDANEYWNDDFSKEDQQSNKGDFFEFFSEEFPAAPASTYPKDNNNIIFCGKLISCKENQSIEDKSQSLKSNISQGDDERKNISSCMFPWKISQSFNKSRTFPSSSSAAAAAKEPQGKSFNKSLSLPAAGSKKNQGILCRGESKKFGDEKFDFSVKNVSVLATPVKSRWYLFAFGIGRFPMEIELKDMKMRQSRKSKAMKFQVPDGGEPENVKGDKEGRRSAKGLWGLLKVLGWKSKHTNSAEVQAFSGCIPLV